MANSVPSPGASNPKNQSKDENEPNGQGQPSNEGKVESGVAPDAQGHSTDQGSAAKSKGSLKERFLNFFKGMREKTAKNHRTEPPADSDENQTDQDDVVKPKWFTRQGLLWHFGRYRGDSPKRPPFNQVLVGREKERATLIRQLLNLPKRSSFLVTGSRGSGKTRFVDHCLNAYEQNLLARYMRTDAGRTVYWDKIMLFILLILAAMSVSLLREVVLLVTKTDSLPYLFLAIPLIVIALVPLVYAETLAKMIQYTSDPERAVTNRRKALGYFATYGLFTLSIMTSTYLTFLIISVVLLFVLCKSSQLDGVNFRLLILILINSVFCAAMFMFWGWEYISGFLISLLLLAYLHFFTFNFKKIQYLQVKVCFYYALFLASLYVLVSAVDRNSIYLSAMYMIVFFILTLASLKKNKEHLLIKRSEMNSVLFALLFVKVWFFVAISANVLKSVVNEISSALNLFKLTEVLSYSYFENFNLSVQLLTIPALFIVFLILEYDLIILPQGYRLFLEKTNPVWRKRRMEKEGVVKTESTKENESAEPEENEKDDTAVPEKVKKDEEDHDTENRPGDKRDEFKHLKLYEQSQNHMKYTFFWQIFNNWLPIITIRINLGFDTLDYRRVVEAMLLGLKKSFHKQFLSYSSFIANIQRVGIFLIFSLLSSVVGSLWFGSGFKSATGNALGMEKGEVVYHSDELSRRGTATKWIEDLPVFFKDFLFWEVFKEDFCKSNPDDFHSLRLFFPDSIRINDKSKSNYLCKLNGEHCGNQHVEILFFLYHLLLLLIFYVIYYTIRNRSVLFPYFHVYREIEHMLSKFTSKTSGSVQESMPFKIPGFGNNFTKKMAWKADLLDPRTLELELISLLYRAQNPGIPLLRGPEHRMTLPQSEITFIFDELDKLGVRTSGEEEKENFTPEHLVLEKRRNVAIQSLLADMKNLLSSGSARFIFIGGRDIHDEWVADRAQRIPFLTNIFDAEIYLPSLLTDHPPHQSERMDWTARIRELLSIQFRIGDQVWGDMLVSRFNSLTEHSAVNRLENTYNDHNLYDMRFEEVAFQKKKNDYLSIIERNELSYKYFGKNNDLSNNSSTKFLNDFLNFMTFRSYGNPKLLLSLLNNFIVNLEMVDYRQIYPTSNTNGKQELKESEYLYFDYKSIFRIQMISSIYQTIERRFNRKLTFGDDKPVVTLFYIVNFLLKFHRRGFSWTSIEHVDELVHIHKSIETRTLIKDVIADWGDRYLDRIRNGIFDFRFSHGVSAELRLLSKFHLDELAAINFTLDESRHLKALYRQLINEEGEQPNFEYFAVLGELHEYDGDFLYARNYFQKALKHLDEKFLDNPFLRKLVLNVEALYDDKPGSEEDKGLALVQFLNRVVTAPEMFQSSMDWAVNRLRFLIRIAMTHELASHFENARFSYRAAAVFGQALYIAWQRESQNKNNENLDLAKTLNIIFLPKFAEAWAMEKSPATLDAGVGMLEKYLVHLEQDFLVLVRKIHQKKRVNTPWGFEKETIHSHINFYVILAELLHKLGDMYFTKGKNLITPNRFSLAESIPRTHGFLSSASEKYIRGMAYLLVYLNRRINESGLKYRISWVGEPRKTNATFADENLPDYFVRVLLGIVRDLSFTLMAKTSIHGVLIDFKPKQHGEKSSSRKFKVDYESADSHEDILRRLLEPIFFDLRNFLDYQEINFYQPIELMKQKTLPALRAIVTHESLSQRENLILSLALQLIASRELYKGGYPGKAIRSFLQTAETVQHYLEWILLYQVFGKGYPSIFLEQPFQKDAEEKETLTYFANELYLIGNFCVVEAKALADNSYSSGRNAQRNYVADALKSLVLLFQTAGFPLKEASPPSDSFEILNSIKNKCAETLFPFGFRLRGMKSLCEHLILKLLLKSGNLTGGDAKEKTEWEKALNEWDADVKRLNINLDELCREIIFLDQQFDNNYTFSPFYQGTTFALAYLHFSIRKDTDKAKFWRKHALQYLSKCQQMFTQGRAYYEFISNHYFLYEDFNDREFQFGHAIQMAGSGVVAVLLKILRDDMGVSAEKLFEMGQANRQQNAASKHV